jgi:hypothetical protein
MTLNNAMSNTPWSPALKARDVFKHGSLLSGKQQPVLCAPVLWGGGREGNVHAVAGVLEHAG